jgi:hypothetical protein
VTTSDYDLGNGTYDLVLALGQVHLVIEFGKSLRAKQKPAIKKASPASPEATEP